MMIPGTQTSFKIGGYVKLDYDYDFSVARPAVGGFDVRSIPLPNTAGHGVHGVSQLTASESRFNIETRTPTIYGEMKTFIEGDFTNPNGVTNNSAFTTESDSSGFRLRHAYGTLGPFLAGQTFSTYRDTTAEPEILDIFAQVGVSGPTRVPQIRYTYDMGDGFSLIGGVENPETFFASSSGAITNSNFGIGGVNRVPDGILKFRFEEGPGHLEIRGALRQLRFDNTTGINSTAIGWGVGISGHYDTFGKDQLQATFSYGDGNGRYFADNGVPDAAINTTTGAFTSLVSYGGDLSYQHWWLNNLRTNVTGGFIHVNNESSVFSGPNFAAQNQWFTVERVNLLWSPVPTIDLGPEFIYGYRRTQADGSQGFERLMVSAKYRF
ncbi:MAG TPA: DcaP family trimeric outer membrane transporter [Stellaceae bacterium]|nr:DcaP family trimeric outer membrane transporter [Stellaceae bacterium]